MDKIKSKALEILSTLVVSLLGLLGYFITEFFDSLKEQEVLNQAITYLSQDLGNSDSNTKMTVLKSITQTENKYTIILECKDK